MSTIYLRVIPTSPSFVPNAEAQLRARKLFEQLIEGADELQTIVTEEIEFVDAGGNLPTIRCPHCKSDLNDWWMVAVDKAYESHFRDLNLQLPCCGATRSLNDLDYEYPVGFARFMLQARDPHLLIGFTPHKKRDLSDSDMQQLEQILGCSLRRIWARI